MHDEAGAFSMAALPPTSSNLKTHVISAHEQSPALYGTQDGPGSLLLKRSHQFGVFEDYRLKSSWPLLTSHSSTSFKPQDRLDFKIFSISSHSRIFSSPLVGIAGFYRPGASQIIALALSCRFAIPIGTDLRVTNDVDMLTFTIVKYPNL